MSSSSSSSVVRVRHIQFLRQQYFLSTVFETPHDRTVYAPSAYSHVNFIFSSQNSPHDITPNYNSIQPQDYYNVEEEENNGVFEWVQEDEVMIVEQNPMSNDDQGLSKRDISKYLKKRKRNEDDGSEICTICQDDLLCEEQEEDGVNIGVLNCGHKYHAKCIKKWLQMKNLCPLCKSTGLSIN